MDKHNNQEFEQTREKLRLVGAENARLRKALEHTYEWLCFHNCATPGVTGEKAFVKAALEGQGGKE